MIQFFYSNPDEETMERLPFAVFVFTFCFPASLSAGEKPIVEYRAVQRDDGGTDVYFSPKLAPLGQPDEAHLENEMAKAACIAGCHIMLSQIGEESKLTIRGSQVSDALSKVLAVLGKRLRIKLKRAKATAEARGSPLAPFNFYYTIKSIWKMGHIYQT